LASTRENGLRFAPMRSPSTVRARPRTQAQGRGLPSACIPLIPLSTSWSAGMIHLIDWQPEYFRGQRFCVAAQDENFAAFHHRAWPSVAARGVRFDPALTGAFAAGLAGCFLTIRFLAPATASFAVGAALRARRFEFGAAAAANSAGAETVSEEEPL